MALPDGRALAQLVLAADREPEERLARLNTAVRSHARQVRSRADQQAKLAKQVQQAFLERGRIRRHGHAEVVQRAVPEEIAFQEGKLQLLGQREHDVGESLLVRPPAEAPRAQQTRRGDAVEVQLQALAARIGVAAGGRTEHGANRRLQLGDERLVLHAQAQTHLMLAERALGHVPAEEPQQFPV